MAADGLTVLGIETSCDETAVGVVTAGPEILADVVLSQVEAHRPFGGIVPEIAARAHVEHLDRSIAQALEEAGVDFAALDGIAATAGPGLIGGLLVGLATAKAIAAATAKPLIAVNHLEGHALTARLVAELDFPYLLALLSGGHCQLLIVEGVGRYHRLGTTIDDAVGEAFDKTAKLLDLGYPGGPALERAATAGDATAHALPRPMKGRAGCDFSFSGLKTAVRHLVQGASEIEVADVAASFQAAVADVLADRTEKAITLARKHSPEIRTMVIAGGVAANKALRTRLEAVAGAAGLALVAPPPRLCTDNGAMIAWAGLERLRLGLVDPLDFAARARWPLDPEAPPAPFAGVKA
ncbi:MAG: tRNA (adenosine(37)-N6)-threonylcarbamoyltransferase complex transferase subunit TsaD [Alphaproteobacteria bacterium]|nr:tRNA (adenosine(37)-N6)-threonylcarbamoyltransferase complex transferase subunit TsaD [Alphaproteobacteria bacterium]